MLDTYVAEPYKNQRIVAGLAFTLPMLTFVLNGVCFLFWWGWGWGWGCLLVEVVVKWFVTGIKRINSKSLIERYLKIVCIEFSKDFVLK